MGKQLQLLVAATCVAVLVAIGIFAYDRVSAAMAASAAATRADKAADRARVAECRRDIAEWETGDRAKIIAASGGDFAEFMYGVCLGIVDDADAAAAP